MPPSTSSSIKDEVVRNTVPSFVQNKSTLINIQEGSGRIEYRYIQGKAGIP